MECSSSSHRPGALRWAAGRDQVCLGEQHSGEGRRQEWWFSKGDAASCRLFQVYPGRLHPCSSTPWVTWSRHQPTTEVEYTEEEEVEVSSGIVNLFCFIVVFDVRSKSNLFPAFRFPTGIWATQVRPKQLSKFLLGELEQ